MALDCSSANMTTDLVKNRLLLEYSRKKEGQGEKPEDEALFLKKSFRKSKMTRRCFGCNSPNHILAACPQKRLDKNKKEEEEKSMSAFSGGKLMKKDVWICDSGASKHMTGQRSLLQNYERVDNLHNVTTACGTTLKCVGKGNGLVEVHSGLRKVSDISFMWKDCRRTYCQLGN